MEKMILVTGATGLVGGNLIWHLLQENDRVAAIRRPASNLNSLRTIFRFYTSTPEEYLERIDWRIADVLDQNSILEALHDVSIVYHCAALVSFNGNAETLLETNVAGTRNVVRAALEKRVNKFCFVSSIAACGRAFKDEQVDENSVWIDSQYRSSYSRSKYCSEQEVWSGIKDGLNVVIINPGVILGVSGTEAGSSQLFSQVKKGLMFYTHGGSGYVDVRDVARAMIQLMNSNISGERFIVVSENCSNKDILSWMADGFGKRRPFICIGKQMLLIVGCLSEAIGKAFHFRPLIDRSTARAASTREYYSNLKIKKAINFQVTPIEKCISDVCKFQLSNKN